MPISARHNKAIEELRRAAPSLYRNTSRSSVEVVAARRRSAAHLAQPQASESSAGRAEVFDPDLEGKASRGAVDWSHRIRLLMAGTVLMFVFGGIAARVMNSL
jgi:hypothetical protein